MHKHLFCFLFLGLIVHIGVTQEYFYRVNYLGVEQGLSFRHATSVLQDHQGFMWIGTQNGLNRYDGYEFKHYTSAKSELLPQLSGNRINDLALDAEGNIWIATSTGLDVLNPETDQIKNFSIDEVFANQSDIKGIDAITISAASQRIFIHGHQNKAFEFLYNTVEFRNNEFYELSFVDSEEISYTHIANVFESQEKELWVRPANTKQFFQMDSTFQIIQKIELPDSIGSYSLVQTITNRPDITYGDFKPNIEFTQTEGKGLSLTGTFCDSYTTFMIQGNLKDTFKVVNENIGLAGRHMPLNYFEDKAGDLLVALDNSLKVVNQQAVNEVSTKLLNLKNDNVTDFCQSKDGTIWVSTNFGVYRLTKKTNPFNFYLNQSVNEKGYGKSTRGIVEGVGNTWYVTVVHDGVWKVNRVTGEEKQLIPKQLKQEDKVYDILPYAMHYQDASLWMCNWFNNGVLRLDLNTLKLEHIRGREESGGFGRSMAEGNGDTLWIGTDHGLFTLEMNSHTYRPYQTPVGKNALSDKDIAALQYDSSSLWVGTRANGLYQIDEQGNVQLIANKKKGLTSNSILSICKTKQFIWVGTPAGLNRIDLDTKHIQQFGKKSGLPDNSVNAIASKGKFLWISTNAGLCKFNTTDGTASAFFEEDGLIHEEFNYSSQLSLANGTLLFGGMNGLVEVKEGVEESRVDEQNLVLTEFERSGNKSAASQSLYSIRNHGVEIEPFDKSFQFKFTYLDLFSSKNLQYKYKLEGYDDDWILNGFDNKVRFNQLPAGEYTFMVKALNRYGNWSENTLSIPVRVQQVFYKKAWFILLCIVIISILLFLAYSVKVREIKRLGELRLQIASNLHDDVGSLLTQVSMQSELLKAGVYKGEEEKKELSKISENSQAAVSTMSDVVWSIDSRQDQLSDLLDRMKDYASDLLTRKEISFSFHQNDDLSESQTLAPDFRQSVYLVFKEAINNVAKHSNATSVEVTIKAKKNYFKMSVFDNGSIDKSENRRSGQGLKNMKMRADKIGAKLYLHQHDGFSVTLEVN